MKLINPQSISKIAQKIPFSYKWALKKMASLKGTLSYSILDRKTNMVVPLMLLSPGIVLLLAFTIVPMVLNIYGSFTDDNGDFTIQNYVTVLTDSKFAFGVRNSFIYGIFTLPMIMIISLVISSIIAKLYRKYARGFWQTIFFMPYVTNGVAISLMFVQLFNPNGLLNSVLGVKTAWLKSGDEGTFNALVAIMVNGIWNGLAFNILIYTTAMLSVDKNLYRSASIDGCSEIKQFFTITLPSIRGTINFIVTLGIIGGLKVFPLALFQNKPEDAFNNGGASIMLYVYLLTKQGNLALSGASSIALFIIGVTFSSIIRGGFLLTQVTLNNLGERNVWVKTKS
ncbi:MULTISPECIES: carbohydrate ABC transporter permease [unclassified Mycoplasma]|uniref:carbohydrate ABC transporter permease n=1 Tax=unclassified Mycoplasma TaxID=2683645 RepID=UPI00211BED36|nr:MULTISPECIES: sugar ABC transporter permease [unclassified Mycoplasma]UUM20011.1 sugar ABC transporter permease [Mycoplasma sp. 1578d]UUM24992.1 sugar ABC transporter permease [Mycoplasma sp. 3686d]